MRLTISKVVSRQINLDEISIEQGDVWMKDVEEKISEALREAGKEMACEAFQGIINSKAPAGGIKEWCPLWGDIRLFFPRPRGGAFPKLKIPSSTPGVSSLIIEMCARKPFRQSERIIMETQGIRIPRSTLWKHFQDQAESLPELPDVEPQPAEAVIVSADGTMISLQDGSKAEARIALAYTERRDHTLLNKVVYASVEPSETFNAKASELIRRKYSVDMNTRGVVIGDGASWITSLRDEHFPQMRLQLDVVHVLRKAGEFLSHFRDEIKTVILRRLKFFMGIGSWELFRGLMVNLMKSSPHHEAFWDWILFVKRRWHELTGFIGQEGPLAENTSSPCEKYVDLIICRRLKHLGASWSRRGANNMLRVRTYLFNREDNHNQT